MICPNTNRTLIKRVSNESVSNSIIVPGQLKAGENLFVGEIVHGGDTKFIKGQIVYYSEYSAAAITDMAAVMRKEKTLGQATSEKEVLYVVAEDDIMAYEETDDADKS